MGRRRIIGSAISSLILAGSLLASVSAAEFRHVGDFLLQSHFKLTGDRITNIPMKPIAFHVFTDGVKIRISTENEEESHSTFEIYRSDGIGRPRKSDGALEMIPGVQAMSRVDGILKHLRLSAEGFTITTFPGVSDQTIVSHAIAATTQPAVETATPPAKP